MRVRHHFTVDVEEYFHPTALTEHIPKEQWDGLARRSPALVGRILELMASRGVRGTFFVLGWLAKREPGVVRAIADAGHEIASHGWGHQKVTTLEPEEFRRDIRRSKEILEEVSGQAVLGYRAPSFSILPGYEWALDILLEEGFLYDSSMFPVKIHPGYGYPAASRDPHLLSRDGGQVVELPPVTLKVGSLSLPAAGGAYLRFFAGKLVRMGLRSAEERGAPGTLYCHPWEFDTELPHFTAPFMTQLRMRGGIRRVKARVKKILDQFEFRPMGETVAEIGEGGLGFG